MNDAIVMTFLPLDFVRDVRLTYVRSVYKAGEEDNHYVQGLDADFNVIREVHIPAKTAYKGIHDAT